MFSAFSPHPPSPSLPNSLLVQRQGTRSCHWLDFHTVPSTEHHVKLIRVNNCGGALLSRAPIGLAWPGPARTDGLQHNLGAEEPMRVEVDEAGRLCGRMSGP